MSRFALAYFYEPESSRFDANYEPTISFAVPSKNEEENIRETISKIAQTNYPKDKFDIIANIGIGFAGRDASCYLDGERVIDTSAVDERLNSGGIGFKTWDPQINNSELIIKAVSVEEI